MVNPAQINLPDNPTAEQFAQAEPIILKQIIESVYTSGIDRIVEYRRVKPGSYTGEFRDGIKRFSFTTTEDDITYKPINPDDFD